ncbi:MAG TPA: ABC transporter ATP-binding protein [Symbiobacteriaceae bacterium]|nr:ABC transporter ATP-binding protein [Symbiobacteriaceae bacterium]
MGKVVLDGVVKRYGNVDVVKQLDLTVNQGEFLTLLGPSGCGKTTTLMLIAGFEYPTAGRVMIDGVDVTRQPPFLRNVNTVFQNYALFPHMKVFDNVAFGLKTRKTPKGEIAPRVREALELVQMGGYSTRSPRQLSGGQQQRVALARALVLQPEVLLLDEPLGALDLKLRKEMQVELKQLHRKLGTTFLFVTHDQEEALTMSDRIVVMNQGQIEQVGAPAEVYDRPRTKFVAEFIGEANLLRARVLERTASGAVVEAAGMRLALNEKVAAAGDQVYLCVRPERVRIATAPGQPGVAVEVTDRIYVGSGVRLIAKGPGGMTLLASGLPGSPVAACMPGQTVRFTWDAGDCVPLADTVQEQAAAAREGGGR